MLKHTAERLRRTLLVGLIALNATIPKVAFGSEYATAATTLPCESLTHEALGGMQGALDRGQAFGIPKGDWTNDVADAFRRRLDACDGAAANLDWSLKQHFDYIWKELGPDLNAQRAAVVQQAEAAKLAEKHRLEQAAIDNKAAEEQAAVRDRLKAQEIAAKEAVAEQQRKVVAARLNNPACAKADGIRKDIDNRSGGDMANLLGLIVMTSQNGDSTNACRLADDLYQDLDRLRAASVDCSAAEASQILGVKNSLYAMRKEMSCLGWFE
ncbi:hypothetical protein [Mesorhizobium sp. Mes31]|uniref:hypothetical protein n=1 Tax=Mesorhizobium sp. Mes31 TaxID=2926017 RepID=UPI0021187B81|nr:hypothetical protein [Mesorhizobium sp. Mes31]